MMKALSRLVGPAEQSGVDQMIVPGVLAGMVAAVPMALTGVVASMFQEQGPLGPIQRVAYVVVDNAMVATAEAQWAKNPFLVDGNFLIFGLLAHLAMGALFGAGFGLFVDRLGSRRRSLLAGPLYGLAVMVLMLVVVLPVADSFLGADGLVRGIPGRIGYLSFFLQHLVFGWYVGVWRWPQLEPSL